MAMVNSGLHTYEEPEIVLRAVEKVSECLLHIQHIPREQCEGTVSAASLYFSLLNAILFKNIEMSKFPAIRM